MITAETIYEKAKELDADTLREASLVPTRCVTALKLSHRSLSEAEANSREASDSLASTPLSPRNRARRAQGYTQITVSPCDCVIPARMPESSVHGWQAESLAGSDAARGNERKAQVVAYSRLATLRYFAALQTARDELLHEAAALLPEDKALCLRPPKVQAMVQAWRYRETLRAIEFSPVISGGNNDDPAWKAWTESAQQEQRINLKTAVERFKIPFALSPSKGERNFESHPRGER